MTAALRQIIAFSRAVRCVNKHQIKNLTRSVIGDRVRASNEESFTERILLYLNSDKPKTDAESDIDSKTINILKKGIKTVEQYDLEQIIISLNLLGNREYVNKKDDFLKLLNDLDVECCQRLNYLNVKDILKVLHGFMNVISSRITECNYYNFAITELFKQAENLPKEDLIQLVFYIGLQKKSPKAPFMLKRCMKYLNQFINNMSIEEVCIVCNSMFKTSTNITNQLFLNKVVTYLSDNLYLLKDPALFITLIKTIRHNRFQNEDLLSTISCAILFNQTLKYYSFTAMCHILALYADFLYYDDQLLQVFERKCLEKLNESEFVSKNLYFLDQPRTKDIKRFLWALSNLNYKLNNNDIDNYIIPQILDRIKGGEFEDDPGSLIEIVLYLWMMNYYAYELVPYALTKENIQIVRAEKTLSKQRLNLLLLCMYFEDHDLYKKLNLPIQGSNNYDMSRQLKKRPLLQRLTENLKVVALQSDVNKFEVSCQVPFINVIGITGFRKNIYKAVHIEVLDGYTTLKNTESKPSGPMQLKLRILDKSEEGLIVLEADEVDTTSDSELQNLLLNDISLVC